MHVPQWLRPMGLTLVLMLIAAACGGAETGGQEPVDQGAAKRGGVYRVGVEESFNFTGGFDPSGEYLGTAWAWYSNLLTRSLMGYRHVAGIEGNEVLPDLAEDMPQVSGDGLTYTFRLKRGVEFGPPVDREITSRDVVYAFERIATPSVVAQYGFYYTPVIEGMQDFADGKADSISGIETPDRHTVVFRLTQPVGDFLYRLAMPATAPIPEEVAKCFTQAGEYGRYVIASGPYMIEGSEELDISDCRSMEPISGFDPTKRLVLVRNPNYDASTDSPEMREALPDRFEFTINTNAEDIYNKIAAGEYEGEVAQPPAQVLRRYSADESLRDRLKAESGDRTWYIGFDLSQPPFDDVQVRKAVNLVMDKDGLLRAWGGPLRGRIATHIMPPEITGGHPTADEYDPYPSEGFTGDVEAAKEEMAKSRYDSDADGVCDAPQCEGVLHFTRNVAPWTAMEPVIESSLEQIGISVETREFADFYTPWQTIARTSPIASGAGWGKDYADASTFVGTLFHSSSILATGNTNVPLVGITPEIAARIRPQGDISGIPSVDADIERCSEMTGAQRNECWIALDKKLMEEVVPWVPYLWATNIDIISDAVTKYSYDQFSGEAGYAHVAVDASAQ